MNQAEKQLFWSRSGLGYVQDGAFAMYDGIQSTAQPDRVVDLIGGLGDAMLSSSIKSPDASIQFKDNAICFDTTFINAGAQHEFNDNDVTFELVAQIDKSYNNKDICFGIMADNPWFGINVDRISYVRFTMKSGYDVDFANSDFVYKPTYYAASRTRGGVIKYYRNGQLLRKDEQIEPYVYPVIQMRLGIWNPSIAAHPLGSIIGKIFRSSIYIRALDDAEVMKNYIIDCQRFGVMI